MRKLSRLCLLFCLAMGFCACQGTEEQVQGAQEGSSSKAQSPSSAKTVQIIYFGSPD